MATSQLMTLQYVWFAELSMRWQVHALELPMELWRHVFKQLSPRDRMLMRQVCQAWRKFDRSEALKVAVHLNSESKACSFLEFLAQQGNEPGPRLMLTHSQFGAWIMPGLVAVAACQNLHELQIEDKLSLAQAQLLLAAAPPGLAKLDLVTDGDVASCCSFSRLQQLTSLELNVEAAPDHLVVPSGLSTLRNLHSLTIYWSYGGMVMDAQDFGLPALRHLAIWNDPFTADLNLTKFPCLEQLEFLNEEPDCPAWASRQHIRCIIFQTDEVLSTWDLEDLYCHELQLSYFAWCCSISLRDLSLLPYLQKLTLCCPTSSGRGHSGRHLVGTNAEYVKLLKTMQVVLEVPVKVELTEQQGNELMAAGTLIPLSRNGHPLLCFCTSCQRDGLLI